MPTCQQRIWHLVHYYLSIGCPSPPVIMRSRLFLSGKNWAGLPYRAEEEPRKSSRQRRKRTRLSGFFALATEREIKWDDKMLLFLPSEVLLFFFPFPTSFCLAPARRSFVRRWWWGDDVCSVATGGRDKSFLRFSSPHDRRGKGGRSNERKGNGGGRRTDQKLNSEQ